MQVAPSGGQICDQCKWRHLVVKFATNVRGAMLLLNLLQVTESISGSIVPLAMFLESVPYRSLRGKVVYFSTLCISQIQGTLLGSSNWSDWMLEGQLLVWRESWGACWSTWARSAGRLPGRTEYWIKFWSGWAGMLPAKIAIEYHVECVVLSCCFTCSVSSAAADVALEVERSILHSDISNAQSDWNVSAQYLRAISRMHSLKATYQMHNLISISQMHNLKQYLKSTSQSNISNAQFDKRNHLTRLNFSPGSFLHRQGCWKIKWLQNRKMTNNIVLFLTVTSSASVSNQLHLSKAPRWWWCWWGSPSQRSPRGGGCRRGGLSPPWSCAPSSLSPHSQTWPLCPCREPSCKPEEETITRRCTTVRDSEGLMGLCGWWGSSPVRYAKF